MMVNRTVRLLKLNLASMGLFKRGDHTEMAERLEQVIRDYGGHRERVTDGVVFDNCTLYHEALSVLVQHFAGQLIDGGRVIRINKADVDDVLALLFARLWLEPEQKEK